MLSEEIYKLDGEEKVQFVKIPDSEDTIKMSTKVDLNKRKFKIRSKADTPQGETEVKKELEISKDGKTLKMKTTNTTQRGHMFSRTVQEQVYNIQE